LLRLAAGSCSLAVEGVVFLWFTASRITRAARNVSGAETIFESLSFLFAAFLGFAASAQAAN
jgi:hypothetical protein